jgi:benzoyl-CoA reductase/2-hydroxyglutaryl-CoA dehydratase subunit BcrC/BadD/HgdB
MKTIIYTCPYVPAEWIAAHGMRPSRIIPIEAGQTGPLSRAEGVCSFVQGFINKVITDKQADGVVITTVCDQMRRAYDILLRRCNIPLFLMNVPNTWQNVGVQKLYIDELKRLGRFLLNQGGKSPSDEVLVQIMLEYDTTRTSVLGAGGYLPSRQYSEMIETFNRNGPSQMLNSISQSKLSIEGIPLAILGGPLIKKDFEIFDIIEQAGGRIVLDATETGQRGLCAPFDRRGLRDNPLLELASAYFCGIQDASRRPNSGLYRWLKSRLTDREVRGIIFHRYLWCDMWHAELQRLKEWVELPVLDIDTAGHNEIPNQRTTNRIRAFLETLR